MSPAPLGFPVGETAADPWDLLFDKAQKTRPPGVNDLVPFWVYEKRDGYKLVRHVPSLPLSRELGRLKNLKNSLAAYRMSSANPGRRISSSTCRKEWEVRLIRRSCCGTGLICGLLLSESSLINIYFFFFKTMKKLGKGNIKANTNFIDCSQGGSLAFTVNNTVERGLCQTG